MKELFTVIKVVRRIKTLLLKFRIHRILQPFSKCLLMLGYISRLSRWINETPSPEKNDFYTASHDYNRRYQMYTYLIDTMDLAEIDYFEFGVAQGRSFIWWADHIKNSKARFYGFDTFTGLPDDWGMFKKGEMSAEGHFPKADDSRCRCCAGLFQNTLPSFLKDYRSGKGVRKVIHMDADLYSSTLFVLTSMAPFLKIGDILIFDEFNVPLGEFKAYSDFIESYGIKTRLLASINNYYQVAFAITETPFI